MSKEKQHVTHIYATLAVADDKTFVRLPARPTSKRTRTTKAKDTLSQRIRHVIEYDGPLADNVGAIMDDARTMDKDHADIATLAAYQLASDLVAAGVPTETVVAHAQAKTDAFADVMEAGATGAPLSESWFKQEKTYESWRTGRDAVREVKAGQCPHIKTKDLKLAVAFSEIVDVAMNQAPKDADGPWWSLVESLAALHLATAADAIA